MLWPSQPTLAAQGLEGRGRFSALEVVLRVLESVARRPGRGILHARRERLGEPRGRDAEGLLDTLHAVFGQSDLDRATLLCQFIAMSQERMMLGKRAQAWAS